MRTEIENYGAWAEARDRKIKANATKGRYQRWIAADPTRKDLERAINEHIDGVQLPADFYERTVDLYREDWSPADVALYEAHRKMNSRRYINPFICKMRDVLLEWGHLTEGQERAVRESLAKTEAKTAEMKAQRATQDAASDFVGDVGKRQKFKAEIAFRATGEYDGREYAILGFRQDGNVLIYKGNAFPGDAKKGDVFEFQAGVKAHTLRDGVKQTVVNRPTKIARVAV